MIKIPLIFLGISALSTPLFFSLNPTEINATAKQGTVRVNGQSPGSGVIFKREGDRYYVLTAKHVVETPDEYEIITADEQVYPLEYANIHAMEGMDLAVAEFESEQAYTTVELGNSDAVTEGDDVFVAGWPQSGEAIPYIYQFISGSISGLATRPLPGGYGLIYTNTARQGMSGGPVLNDKGKVVGIHGRAEGKEIYLPNSELDTTIVRDGFSLGVPINTFLVESAELPVEPDLAPELSQTIETRRQAPRAYFSRPPRLEGVRVVNNLQFRESEYLFNISFPADAGGPLQEIVFSQTEGRDYPSFSIRDTHAYAGGDRNADLPLGLVANDSDEKTMTVVFDPPVEPGQDITVALKAHRNPREDTYLYNVVASPQGEAGRSQRIGTGRLQIYKVESLF
ncbi:MAG: DUF2808 domain-containing protein [Cyanobacteria bacterium J06555_13]